MRATCLALFTIALIGCGKIDSSRSTSAVDASPPTITRPDEPARAPATTADNTSRPDVTASTRPADVNTPSASTQPDNTAVNARDADRVTRNPKLPIDQKENQADIDITAKIRQQVLKTDGLSVNARNAKIITADGKVTLRGPVESAAERDTIARIAREVAGDANVEDQLEVKTPSTAPTSSTTNP